MRYSIVVFFLLFSTIAFGQQENKVLGIITDSIGNPLQAADVQLVNDSSQTVYKRISDKTGRFIFKNIAKGKYTLNSSYIGYQPSIRRLSIDVIDTLYTIDTIRLYTSMSDLGEVVIQASSHITFKDDTTIFNVQNIGTKPNAVASDVLKKLKGVEVDKDGTVKAQGEEVKKILVNGKRFFGDDGKMATENLPAELIEKIQIYDGKSDQAAFSGIDDGNNIKTLNIITKREVNKGYFGKLYTGYGTQNLFEIGGNMSFVNNKEEISIVGQWNNNNKQMFNTRGRNGFNGGSPGNTETIAGGINYKNTWGKTDIAGSYRYTHTDKKQNSYSFAQRLLLNDTLQNSINDRPISQNTQTNHNFNINIETKINERNSIIIRPSISYSQSQSNNVSQSHIYRVIQSDTTQISEGFNQSNNNNFSWNAHIEATYRHRFEKKGRTFSISTDLSTSQSKGEGFHTNNIYTFKNNSHIFYNRNNQNNNSNQSYSLSISYTEPLWKENHFLVLNTTLTQTETKANRQTYNFDSSTMLFSQWDSTLSNQYYNKYQYERASLTYNFKNQKINFNIGSGVQFAQVESINYTKNYRIPQQYINLYPTMSLMYTLSTSQNLRFNYSGRTNQPSINQLQPVLDNSNQLNQYTGNPDLQQSFTNSLSLRYQSINKASGSHFFAMTSSQFTQNAVVNEITQLNNGGQLTRPINMNGFYNIMAFVNYGFSLPNPKSNMNIGIDFSNSKSGSKLNTLNSNGQIINSISNFTYNNSIGNSLRWNSIVSEAFDINLGSRLSYHWTKYTVSKTPNADYLRHSINADFTWYTPSGWISTINFDYSYYKGLSEGFNRNIPLLGASIAKQIFKNKAGEIKLSVHDLLNQNKAITTSRSENLIQQTSTNVLQRYLMLTFTYNLRNFGSLSDSSKNPQNRSRENNTNRRPPNSGRAYRML